MANEISGIGLARTLGAIRQWCEAFRSPTYVVAVVPPPGEGPAQRRHFTEAQLLDAVRWLRHRNAAGANIYARPTECRHVLVDDLCVDGLDVLRRWHRPAVETETSPANFQAWLTVSEDEVSRSLATSIARLLAFRFGADACAADGVHLGRLPGLTNRKPMYGRDGSYPWVLLRRAAACIDPRGELLLHEAACTGEDDAARISPEAPSGFSARLGGRTYSLVPRDPSEEHSEAMRRIVELVPAGCRIDRSRADYSIALRLLRRGMPPAQAELVVMAGAKAAGLEMGLAEAYARRTVRAAEARLIGAVR